MTEGGSVWGEDGWGVQPGKGEIIDSGGPELGRLGLAASPERGGSVRTMS
jgi:hypothetical protein